jgi:ribonuclease P protein component
MIAQFSFRKNEKLSSRKLISELFEKGRSKSAGCLRVVYYFTDEEIPAPAQVLISVSKKAFKRAIKRNKLKRRIREAFRLNKNDFLSLLVEKKRKLLIAIIYTENSIQSFFEIQISLQQIIKMLSQMFMKLK